MKSFSFFFFLGLLNFSLLIFSPPLLAQITSKGSESSFKILIDPGHGGVDKGAVYGKAREAQIVYSISEKLQKKLSRIGFQTELTRKSNQGISLKSRVEKSMQNDIDLYVSLHANAVNDPRVKGVEYFFEPTNSSRLSRAHQSTKTLSQNTEIKEIVGDIRNQFRQKRSLGWAQKFSEQIPGHIKQAPFFVISKADSPSVLIEVGFLSNPQESQRLMTENYQEELAEKMAISISDFAHQRRRIACATNSHSQDSKPSVTVSGCEQTTEKTTN